ncbi:MAG: TPM domain-containing protein, partial [Pseudomonadota bacterium]
MMVLRVLALAVLCAAPAFAQSFPDPQSDTVSDFADVLDATAEGRISRLLVETREATGVQMVVV